MKHDFIIYSHVYNVYLFSTEKIHSTVFPGYYTVMQRLSSKLVRIIYNGACLFSSNRSNALCMLPHIIHVCPLIFSILVNLLTYLSFALYSFYNYVVLFGDYFSYLLCISVPNQTFVILFLGISHCFLRRRREAI